jgi:predicted RNase H-like HicB family nuclease
MSTYKVEAQYEDDKWSADVPSVPGAHTWARSLEGLDAAVREVIALVLNLPDGAEPGLELTWQYATGNKAWDQETAALRTARHEVDQKAAELATRTAAVTTELVQSFSMRDTAVLLGVSFQRVSQVALKVSAAHKAPVKSVIRGKSKKAAR